jgi:hypothetical protein
VALSNLTLNVYLRKGNGQFQVPKVFPTGGAWFTNVAVGDFNRDGKQDVAVSVPETDTTGTIDVLLGNGDGTFPGVDYEGDGAFRPALGCDPAALQVITADFNGDGVGDLALVAAASDEGVSVSSLTVLLGKGHGMFSRLRRSFRARSGARVSWMHPSLLVV